MKFLLIIVTVAACCYAAPTSDLQHPSPINPSVVVDVKPQEKETQQNVRATSLPAEVAHHITKRDHKPGHDNKQKAPAPAPEPPKQSHHHTHEIAKKPVKKSHQEPPKPSTSNKRNRRHTENHQQPQTLPEVLTELAEPTKQVFQKPQTLPAILTDDETTQQHKRDIPVPLVPKHQHPEESPKDSSEEKSDDDKENKKTKENPAKKDEVQVEDLSDHAIPPVVTSTTEQNKHIVLEGPTEHPIVRPKPVPVAELFARAHDN